MIINQLVYGYTIFRHTQIVYYKPTSISLFGVPLVETRRSWSWIRTARGRPWAPPRVWPWLGSPWPVAIKMRRSSSSPEKNHETMGFIWDLRRFWVRILWDLWRFWVILDGRWTFFLQRVPCFGDDVETFPSSIYSQITTIWYDMIYIYI